MSDQRVQAVLDALDPTPAHEAEWPVSRRQTLRALASVGALAVVPGAASAQSAGTVLAESASFSNYGSASTANGYDLTIDGDVFAFEGDKTIGLPDGADGEKVVLPDGATAAEVVGPDGSVVWQDNVIPDAGNLQSRYTAASYSLSDGDTISSAWEDPRGGFDAAVNGSPIFRSAATPSGDPAVEFTGSDYFDTGFVQDTTNDRSIYFVRLVDATGNFNTIYGAQGASGTLNADYLRKDDNGDRRALYAGGNQTFGSMSTGAFVIDSLIASGGTLEWYTNGSSVGSVSYTGQGSIGYNDYIGARNAGGSAGLELEGQIADILRYDVGHSDQTRGDVESFLNSEYSVF